MLMLSDHFSLEELSRSDMAVRLGINNTPPEPVIGNLRKLASVLELIRAALSERAGKPVAVSSNSGYRCEALEKVLCAKDYKAWCARKMVKQGAAAWRQYFDGKAHPQGMADDFTAPAFGTPLEIVRYIASQPHVMRHIDKIIMEGSWVHVAISDAPRGIVLTATFDANGVASYQEGLA